MKTSIFQCLCLSCFALKWKYGEQKCVVFQNTSLKKNWSLRKFDVPVVEMGESDNVCNAV